MKCSRCGNEFGGGANCQYCGVDRVTGLGNYSGYNTPQKDNYGYDTSGYSGLGTPNTTVCYSCGEIIPANSDFCPYCSKELYVTCPKCGSKYSSQFPACNKCGTNRIEYFEKQKHAQEQSRKTAALKEKEIEKLKSRASEIRAHCYIKGKEKAKSYRIKGFVKFTILIALLFCDFTYIEPNKPVSWQEGLLAVFLVFSTIFLFLFCIGDFYNGFRDLGNDEISSYKRLHPDDPVNNYL